MRSFHRRPGEWIGALKLGFSLIPDETENGGNAYRGLNDTTHRFAERPTVCPLSVSGVDAGAGFAEEEEQRRDRNENAG